jgi:hypothetical protein
MCNISTLCSLFTVLFSFRIHIMYSLIEFPMDDGQKPEVEVVPNIWLENKDESWNCYWPQAISTIQIRKVIEKCHSPQVNWLKFKCRVLRTYGKFFYFLN